MSPRSCVASFVVASFALLTAPADAAKVRVTINGTVEFALPTSGPLAPVNANDPATIVLEVDSDVFLNSPNFPTRGYPIDLTSFSFTMGSVTIGLANPQPAGQVPYFILRDNDPGVDGFMISRVVDFPFGVRTTVPNVDLNFHRTFNGVTALPSLDILDALGEYGLRDLSVFNWTLDLGPGTPVGVNYESMSLELVCGTDLDGDGSVGPADLALLLGQWGGAGSADFDGDGQVGPADLAVMLGAWGTC